MKSLARGTREYDEGKKALDSAINRYSTTVIDFTASCVFESKLDMNAIRNGKLDEKFSQWLSPAHWHIEAQLNRLRSCYQRFGTLKWVHRMAEFQNWTTSELNTEERLLWITGAPGVGKSTLGAHFVGIVRGLDRDASLGYFFVRRGFSGLARASDIIRSLAHQFAATDPEIRKSLEALKASGFKIDDNLGVHLMYKKLLVEPLARSTKRIYIIVDGLDEIDTAVDMVDGRRQSREILIECLHSLESARLLFLCRPHIVQSKFKEQSVIKSIGMNENRVDIESYLAQQLDNKLQTRFSKENVNPIPFFLNAANGNFLWVVLRIEQLAKTDSKSEFRRVLENLTRAPSDMAQTYIDIFRGLSTEQRKWVREILRWVVISRRQLTIEELQSAVEWCLDDELHDFQEFLEIQCGSILLISNISETSTVVQLVHETLRSFLIDDKTDMKIDIGETHEHLTAASLEILSMDDAHPIYSYVSSNWNYHLIQAKRGKLEHRILSNLHRFFCSPYLKAWVYREFILRWESTERETEAEIEDQVLRDVWGWLTRYHCTDLNDDIQWRNTIVDEPAGLGQQIGKSAALIWLFDDLSTETSIVGAFKLATGHYWRRDGRFQSSYRDDLDELIKTEFAPLLSWAGHKSKGETIVKKNMKVAHETLKQWDESFAFKESITCKSPEELWEEIDQIRSAERDYLDSFDLEPTTLESCSRLASIHRANGQLRDSVKALKAAVQYDDSHWPTWMDLADTCRALNEWDEAIVSYRKAIDIQPDEFRAYENLAETYRALGRHDDGIQILEVAVQRHPEGYTFSALGWAYRASLNEPKAIEYFKRSVEVKPACAQGWKAVADIHNICGEFDKAIEMYLEGSKTNPTCSWVWSGLGDAYRAKGNITESIKAYRVAVKRNPTDSWAWTSLGDAYRVDKQYEEAIQAFWTSIEKNPRDSWPWKGLAESYKAKNDINRAMTLYAKAIQTLPSDYSLPICLGNLFEENQRYKVATECFKAALHRSPNRRRLLCGFTCLPISHMFSNFPVVTINDEFLSSFLWCQLTRSLTAIGDTSQAEDIYDEVIQTYKMAITDASPNHLLLRYSSYLSSRGFDPFERKEDLPIEIVWTVLAEVYKVRENYLEAIESYKLALKTLPRNKWLWIRLSDMYQQAGENNKAHEARRKAEEVHDCYSKTFYIY